LVTSLAVCLVAVCSPANIFKVIQMDTKSALKAHMAKGKKSAHPDSNVKKMKAGGPTSMDRKNMGRNMSRIANQKGSK
jgi:gluconate kinase